MGFLSGFSNREVPHLALRGESPGLSRVAAGNLGFLSSSDRDLKPARVASGKSSLLSSCKGPLGNPLQLVQGLTASSRVEVEPQGSSPAMTGISGSLWRFPWGVIRHLVLRHGTPLSS